jgi:SAM-dependent methyltransferase
MMTTEASLDNPPNRINRIRSRQAGHPSGLLGRIIGRAMVKDTANANDHALELLQLTQERTILEIGFGQGRTAAKLIERGHQVLGVEVSDTMLNQATARNRHACRDGRANLVLGDGRTVPFEDNAADAALTAHTIYFMTEPQTTLTQVARVLRPGGRLVVACRVGDDKTPAWMDPDIYQIPTTHQIETMLSAAGFETITHQTGNESTQETHWFIADLPARPTGEG